jgi:transcriptional regulator EpsA
MDPMQTGDQLMAVRHSPPPPPQASAAPIETALLDRYELESLMLNLDASLRIHTRHQFFTWTQGLLQDLVKHKLLICAARHARQEPFHVDAVVAPPLEPSSLSDAFRQDVTLVPHLIKTWEENRFQPVICDTGPGGHFTRSVLARELSLAGAERVLAHGTYDAFGKVASLFLFANRAGTIGPKQVRLAELLVPFLHLSWLRFQISWPAKSEGAAPAGRRILTEREQEILNWIHVGKSNIEIGAILEISPLTVKNHVQKILRKLNVQNRAQAVGRGLALRIIKL